ncbi:hypothetical protein ES703_115379 [subsurface metagenome]
MGRGPIIQGLQEETKLRGDLLFTNPQESKDPLLELAIMDSDASCPKLHPIEDQIIGFGSHFKGLFSQKCQVLFLGHAEGMMHSLEPLLFLIKLH